MKRGTSIAGILSLALLGAALGVLAFLLSYHVESGREALLRYVLFALMVPAIAPSHILLPDPEVAWLQRINASPRQLLLRSLGRWSGILAVLLLPVIVLSIQFGDILSGILSALVVTAAWLYAFYHVMALGRVSQEWQEGIRGAAYRKMLESRPDASFQIPHGMIPALLATTRIFIVSAITLFGVIVLSAFGGWITGMFVPIVLIVWTIFQSNRSSESFDRKLYHSSGLYTELLHNPAVKFGEQAPLPYESLYWVPTPIRPHVWAGLLQLDRRLPMGRLFTLGVLGFWAVLATGVESSAIALYLGVALLIRNAAVFRHASLHLSPTAFHLVQQSIFGWVLTRFWMNLRWTFPLFAVLAGTALISGMIGWDTVLLWTLIDIVFAFLMAVGATYAAEFRFRYRYA